MSFAMLASSFIRGSMFWGYQYVLGMPSKDRAWQDLPEVSLARHRIIACGGASGNLCEADPKEAAQIKIAA